MPRFAYIIYKRVGIESLLPVPDQIVNRDRIIVLTFFSIAMQDLGRHVVSLVFRRGACSQMHLRFISLFVTVDFISSRLTRALFMQFNNRLRDLGVICLAVFGTTVEDCAALSMACNRV